MQRSKVRENMTHDCHVFNPSATLMINRGVECCRGISVLLRQPVCTRPFQTDEHAAPHISSAAAAVVARCLWTGVLCKYEYRGWAISARVVLLNSWLRLNVWQVISEAEDTGGKTHSLGLQSTQQLVRKGWMSLHFFFFFLSTQIMNIITITPLKALQLTLTHLMMTGSTSSWTSQVHRHSHSARDSFLLPFALNWHCVVSYLPPCVSEHLTWVSLSP